MRMKHLTYGIGDADTEVTVDLENKMATLKSGGTIFNLSLAELFDLIPLAQTLREKDARPAAPTQVPAAPLAPTIERKPPPPMSPEYAEHRAKASKPLTSNLETQELVVSNMFVIQVNGAYVGRDTVAGQVEAPTKPIAEARLFPDAEEAVAVARLFLGATVRPFSEVGEYRIALSYGDGSVKFWNGNGIDPSPHVNNSMLISTRISALMTIGTIQPIPGVRPFLIANLA